MICEISPGHRLAEYRIFTSISFVSMTSSPRGFYVCILCVYAWGPAKYGGYRSNHSCIRVSPGTCVALRMSACARIVRIYMKDKSIYERIFYLKLINTLLIIFLWFSSTSIMHRL